MLKRVKTCLSMSTSDEPDVTFLFANADLAGSAGIAA